MQKILEKKEFIKKIISTPEILKNFQMHYQKNELIECENPESAWAFLCAKNFPQMPKNQIAITGTNGKTSTTFFIDQILRSFGKKTMLINSLGVLENGELIEKTNNTTPDAYTIHKNIDNFTKKYGSEDSFLIVEVTSIAILQKRIEFLNLDIGVWTNFSQEHLDYHKTMANYFNSKMMLGGMVKKFYIHNSCSPWEGLCGNSQKNDYTIYGNELVEVTQKNELNVRYKFNAIDNENNCDPLESNLQFNLFGKFQAENILSAIMATSYFEKIENIVEMLKNIELKAPDGRMQILQLNEKYKFKVIIDNSHKPEALENALKSIESLQPNRIILVCGCGGNRDAIKRPMIGAIMQKFSNIAIITSDNPRNEDPMEIIAQIKSGMMNPDNDEKIKIIENRKDAIHYALSILQPGDVCLIAGKGNERTQEIKGESFQFSDADVANQYFGI